MAKTKGTDTHCPVGHSGPWKMGTRMTRRSGRVQKYLCNKCGRTWAVPMVKKAKTAKAGS